jgi:hypothetical protein
MLKNTPFAIVSIVLGTSLYIISLSIRGLKDKKRYTAREVRKITEWMN